jgi:heme/copper-type cytochrome/quinol oxidase subunit 3
MHRLGHPEFGHAGYAADTNTWIGAFNTFVLLTSSLSAVLAHQAAEKKDGKKAFKYLWGTFAGGLTFLVVKSIEWTHEITHGMVITTNAFWSFYYTAAGLHACHVLGGMIIMAIISFDVRKNRELQRVELIGNYWHFVDIVWIFLFPLLYIAK